jgi:hypothetical protein
VGQFQNVKDGVHYFNYFVSPQRGYCQKQTHVKEIIEVLFLYGRQNIAILWHNKDKSNSMAILPKILSYECKSNIDFELLRG